MRTASLVTAVVALTACSGKDAADDYVRRSKAIEAKVSLGMMTRTVRQAVEMYDGKLPTGRVGPTPAGSCCGQPKARCTPDATTWADPMWQQLHFELGEPFYFQYSYASDGSTFTASAVADLDCDGHPTTFTVTGKLGVSGLVIDDTQLGPKPR